MRNKLTLTNLVACLAAYTISFAIGFFTSPYLVSRVGAEAYGFVSLASNIIGYATIATIALNSMSSRFITIEYHKKNKEQANIFYSSGLLSNLIIALVLAIGSVAFILNIESILNISSSNVIDVKLVFGFTAISAIVGIVGSVVRGGYFVQNKIYLSNIKGAFENILRVVVIVLMYTTFITKTYYITLATFVATLFSFAYDLYFKKKLLPDMHFSYKKFRFRAVRELLSSGIWNALNQIGTILNTGLDLLLCNIFISGNLMGVLAISKTVPTMIQTIQGTLTGIFAPEIVIKSANSDDTGVKESLQYSIKIMGIIMNIPLGIYIGFGYVFFSLWQPTQDAGLLNTLSIMAIFETCFHTSTPGIYNVFVAQNKLRYISLVHLISGLVNTLLVIVLLNTTNLGVYSIALTSSLIGIVKTFAFIFPYAAKCIGEKWYYFYKASIKSFVSIVIIASIGIVFQKFISVDSWIKFFTMGGLTGIVALLINIRIVLKKSERKKYVLYLLTKLHIIKDK